MIKKPLQDEDIVFLLGELRDETPEYPADTLAERRAAFQASAAGLGAGFVAGDVAKGGLLHGATTTELILSALIAATLLIEATAGVYLYRARLLAKLESAATPTLSAVGPALAPSKTKTPTPTSTPTATTTPTATMTPTATLTPTWSPTGSIPPGGQTPAPRGSTPTPGPSSTNPGNRYGWTPTPPGHRTEFPPNGSQGQSSQGNSSRRR